ncbi:MAG: hypothetical protein ACYDAG_04825 [Chloroflexota bacterium]
MLQFHQAIATSAILLMLILALWGIGAGVLKRSVGGTYRSTYVLTMGLFAVQAVIGLGLLITGRRAAIGLHYAYGVVTLIVLGLAYSYTGRASARREAFIFGFAALFTLGLVIRAYMTGA